jgi:hypothetical protein
MWDEKGVNYRELECVDGETRRPVLDSDLVIDPLLRNTRKTECGAKQFLIPLGVRAAPFTLLTRTDYEIHLKNGIVLKDCARARINNEPTATSAPPLPPLQTHEKTQ